MTNNETKLIDRLREAAAAFSRIAGLLDGSVSATPLPSGRQMPTSEAHEVAKGWQTLCEEEVAIAEERVGKVWRRGSFGNPGKDQPK
jgi:hypothetical protein